MTRIDSNELNHVELGAVSGGVFKISNWTNATPAQKVSAVVNSVVAAVVVPSAAAPAAAALAVFDVGVALTQGTSGGDGDTGNDK